MAFLVDYLFCCWKTIAAAQMSLTWCLFAVASATARTRCFVVEENNMILIEAVIGQSEVLGASSFTNLFVAIDFVARCHFSL
jgi:hypothetical protein